MDVFYVSYPDGSYSQPTSFEEARVLCETYGGGIHRVWNHRKPPLDLRPAVRKLMALSRALVP